MSAAQAAGIYEVRAHLFGLAGRLATSRIGFRDVVELRAMVAEMQPAKDIDAYYPLNVAFHARLVELSGNNRVAELYYGGWPLFNMRTLAGFMNGWIVEWHLGMVQVGQMLLVNPPEPMDGILTIPDASGLGLTLNHDALRESEVAE